MCCEQHNNYHVFLNFDKSHQRVFSYDLYAKFGSIDLMK